MLVTLQLPNESLEDVIRRLCEEKTVKKLLQKIESKPYWSDMSDEEYQIFKKSVDRKETSFTPQEVDNI